VPDVLEEPPLRYVPMSYEEWWALPEKPKAEWVDGVAILNSPPSPDHSDSQYEIETLFRQSLTGVRVYHEVGVKLARGVRIPDVMVVRRRPDDYLAEEPPILVAEVLSPSTRREDLVRKPVEYAGGGAGQYWILDPEHRCLDVYELVDGAWQPIAHLDDDVPTATITVAEHGDVDVDVTRLLVAPNQG
jgi:Uma2 family endonuclease